MIAYRCDLAVVDGGFADYLVEYVVNEFDAAVAVAGFNQVAGQDVVVEAGAADAALPAAAVAVGDFAALFFYQLAEDVAFEAVDVPDFGQVFSRCGDLLRSQTAFAVFASGLEGDDGEP